MSDPLCYSRTEPEINGDFSNINQVFSSACNLEGDNPLMNCCPKGVAFLSATGESAGGLYLCEETCCCGAPDLYFAWPGPGFGLVSANGSGNVPTGWQTVNCQGDPEIVWTDETKAAIADQTPDDTDCATITDAFTCATTHNPPAHCAMTLGMNSEKDENETEVDSCEILKRMEFIGCHQVYEEGARLRLGLDYGEYYSGLIKNTESGKCLGYNNYEQFIPAGWEKSDSAACATASAR